MRILAIDTSTAYASVAVTLNDKLLGEYVLNHGMTHSQKLVPMIAHILKDLELSPADIDLYAVSNGPGSFTGLRIGITTLKAIAYAVKKPAAGINTLDALARNIPVTGFQICPIIDARNNTVYTSVYSYENGLPVRKTEYMAALIQDVPKILGVNAKPDIETEGHSRYNQAAGEPDQKPVIFLGDAVEKYRALLSEVLSGKCEFAPGNLLFPKASSVAAAALAGASGNLSGSFGELVPFYLRKPQAEREYEKKTLQNQTGIHI